MTAGSLAALVVGAIAVALIVAPLFRRDAAEAEPRSGSLGRARELQAEKEMLLASLKDLEDDRATEKIGDEDYAELDRRLSGRAVEVMQELDELERLRDEAEQARDDASRPLPYPGKHRPGPAR